jgi:polyphosphate kinase 2 (PPK2 family)
MPIDDETTRRIQAELEDGCDEELELELEDRQTETIAGITAEAPQREARRRYFRELFRLQRERVKLQDWVQHSGHKVVIVFEGRDAAGKGGVIKRITQRLNPRVARVVALPAPNDRERTQWYFQRYAAHLPAAGEISDEEQHLRLLGRIHDPLEQWKLSPMDLESRRRWEDYTKAKEAMLERTHIAEAPWWVVPADDKKRARLNCIAHLLAQMPYSEVERAPVLLPPRERHDDYVRHPVPAQMIVPARY